ncbi:MAG: hypothetical protein J6Q51_04310 [Clostridia bacterium]|nr:hypothetical protein [Clostridia bacterium]
MEVFIVVVVIMFAIMVISVNSEKIRKKLRDKKPKESAPKPKPVKKEKYEDNMSYSEYQPVKVDDLGDPDKYEFGTLQQLNEDEEKELTNKSKGKAGRLRGDIKSAKIEKVVVEDLGEYDENEGFFESDSMDNLDDDEDQLYSGFFFPDQNKSISQEIKNLSPELKALLINNVLDKKDEDF